MIRFMYWYNAVVAGGFGIIILLLYLIPGVMQDVVWRGFDPMLAAFVVPIFVVLANMTARAAKNNPEEGRVILRMQIAYKPFTILLILFFAFQGRIHPFWAVLVIAALVIYLVGNTIALRRLDRETA